MYDTRIEVFALSNQRDVYNERIEKLNSVGVFYASRTESGGRENLYASRIVHENGVVFTIRFTDRIFPGMIVLYENQKLKIISTHKEGRRKFLHLKCLKSDAED